MATSPKQTTRIPISVGSGEDYYEAVVIQYTNGERHEAIRYGDATFDLSYEEWIEDFEKTIVAMTESGKDCARERERLEEFKELWDPDEFNNRPCHDCGAEPGDYHMPGCDMEECPRCNEQYFICDCHTWEKVAMWS